MQWSGPILSVRRTRLPLHPSTCHCRATALRDESTACCLVPPSLPLTLMEPARAREREPRLVGRGSLRARGRELAVKAGRTRLGCVGARQQRRVCWLVARGARARKERRRARARGTGCGQERRRGAARRGASTGERGGRGRAAVCGCAAVGGRPGRVVGFTLGRSFSSSSARSIRSKGSVVRLLGHCAVREADCVARSGLLLSRVGDEGSVRPYARDTLLYVWLKRAPV
jgi:hypothetical protein